MRKNKKLNLGKIRIVNLSTVNRIHGGGSDDSCGGDACEPVFTQTKTTKSNDPIVCNNSVPECGGTD